MLAEDVRKARAALAMDVRRALHCEGADGGTASPMDVHVFREAGEDTAMQHQRRAVLGVKECANTDSSLFSIAFPAPCNHVQISEIAVTVARSSSAHASWNNMHEMTK